MERSVLGSISLKTNYQSQNNWTTDTNPADVTLLCALYIEGLLFEVNPLSLFQSIGNKLTFLFVELQAEVTWCYQVFRPMETGIEFDDFRLRIAPVFITIMKSLKKLFFLNLATLNVLISNNRHCHANVVVSVAWLYWK